MSKALLTTARLGVTVVIVLLSLTACTFSLTHTEVLTPMESHNEVYNNHEGHKHGED